MPRIFHLLFILILFSCDSPNKELVITFEESAGLQEGSDVICRDKVIGNVTNIRQVRNDEVYICISLNEMQGIPKDSKFTIHEKDLLNEALYVKLGKSKQYFSRLDKITGEITTLFHVKRRKI